MGLFDKIKKNKNIEESVSIDIETELTNGKYTD